MTSGSSMPVGPRVAWDMANKKKRIHWSAVQLKKGDAIQEQPTGYN